MYQAKRRKKLIDLLSGTRRQKRMKSLLQAALRQALWATAPRESLYPVWIPPDPLH